jgi:hypothetical protein
MSIILGIDYDFGTTIAELSSCDRDHMVHKAMFTIWLFLEKNSLIPGLKRYISWRYYELCALSNIIFNFIEALDLDESSRFPII